MKEQHRTIKVKYSTYRLLKIAAAESGETMLDLVERLVKKERGMKSFTYTAIALDDLTATDLQQEAADKSIVNAQAATITIYKANGMSEAEKAEALYLPDDGRLGIAWGADATWADVKDFLSGVEMWLNDGEAWEAAN